jgi:large subunit ribosomal protein L20
MPRVKRGTKRRARRKKLLKHAKGFFLTKGKLFRSAKEAVNRSLRYTYRDRRVRKRDYRTLWIQRIGAAARNNGITYNQLIHGLKVAGVDLDRKILADMAVLDVEGFTALVETATKHFPAPKKAPVKTA